MMHRLTYFSWTRGSGCLGLMNAHTSWVTRLGKCWWMMACIRCTSRLMPYTITAMLSRCCISCGATKSVPSSMMTAARGTTPVIAAGTAASDASYTVIVTDWSLPGGVNISCCTTASPVVVVCTATGAFPSAARAAACSSSFHSGAVCSARQLGFTDCRDHLHRP